MIIKHTSARITALFLCAAMLLISFVSCSDSSAFPRTKEESAVVMTVGSFEVPFDVYRYFLLNYRAQYENGMEIKSGSPEADALVEYINKYTEKSLQNCYGTLSFADDFNMSIDDSAVKDALDINVANYIEDFGGEDEYVAALAEGYLNDSVFRFVMGVQILQENIYYYMIENGQIQSDDDYVNERIRSDDFIRVKQILIQNDEGDDKEQNLATAKEALARARDGEDFDELIVEYGEDMSMFMNTDGYYFTHNEMLEEFEDAAFALDSGEISDIVETSVGYSIILRLDKEENYIADHFETLREQYLAAQFNILLDARCAAMPVKPISGALPDDILTIAFNSTDTAASDN